jgi:hypothetical protein
MAVKAMQQHFQFPEGIATFLSALAFCPFSLFPKFFRSKNSRRNSSDSAFQFHKHFLKFFSNP